MSFLGLMMAFSVVLVILGSVIEMSTLFFLALASFCTGIVVKENGTYLGAAFYVGSVLLCFFLTPGNKLYVLTYGGMAFYLLVTDFVWTKLLKAKSSKRNSIIITVFKLFIFNAMYIPVLIYAPSLVLTQEINHYVLIGLIVVGQVVLVIYDRAFQYFIGRLWMDMKRKMKI